MSSKDRVTSNLVALGSAAVLTVYAAGFARTQPAAQRFAAESDDRRPAPPSPEVPAAASPAAIGAPTSPAVPTRARPERTTSQAAPAAVVPATKTSVSAKAADTTTAPAVPTPAPVAAVVPSPAAPVSDSARPVAVAPPADSASKPAAKDTAGYKDGLYFGWGTSRHGDIQMGVEIKDGRIKSAFISECNTQYDCSWIFHLPKQVVQRQSAEVDFVSGATQSANALYRAVVNALKQAK